MVVVSDKKKSEDTNGDGIIDRYNADIVSANDYYPLACKCLEGRLQVRHRLTVMADNGKENE